MSNALVVSAKRSATHHPIYVAGPQVGYFYPGFFMEIDLHGGGFDARGALFPGVPWVVIGRGPDYAWSATTSHSDIIDQYVETLCGGDQTHYLYKGQCRAMDLFDAGTSRGPPRPRAHLPDDRPRARHRLREGRQARGRDLDQALDARPRARQRASLRGPRQGPRPLGEAVRPGDEPARVRVQLDVRGQPRHRLLLLRPPADSAGGRRPRPADERRRRLRVAGLRAAEGAPAGD